MKEETKTPQQILSQAREEFERKVRDAIIATYPESVWLPVPKEKRAKNAVAAQLLRDMAPAMAGIASDCYTSTLQSFIEAEIEREEGEKRKIEKSIDELERVKSPTEVMIICEDKGHNQAKDETIAHLKGLSETLKR